jgi:hypothetical protein
MDPAVKKLKAALEAIRDIAANALNQVGSRRGNVHCDGNAKPVPLEAAADTPDARARSSDLFCETS